MGLHTDDVHIAHGKCRGMRNAKTCASDDGAIEVAVAFLLMGARPGRGNHCGAWYSAGAIMGRNERAGGAVLKLAEDLA